MAERRPFGKVNGKDAHLAVLRAGKYMVQVTDMGASLVYYGTDSYNAVLCHDSAEKYASDTCYIGRVVGPYANRISKHQFTIDGETYVLEDNDRSNTLHSGATGYSEQLWTITGQSDTSVTLSLSTPEGQGGFPGSHETEITYILTEDGILTLSYKSTSSKKCPVALTNHAYFKLDDESVKNVSITIPASSFIDVDAILIPTPETPTPVEGTPYDFRSSMKIGDRRDGKYDNSWVLDENAVIHAEGNRAELWCRTTEPAIQMYTGEFLNGSAKAFEGLALETGRYPDTPNRPDFPQAFTEPGKVMESTTSYCLKVKE